MLNAAHNITTLAARVVPKRDCVLIYDFMRHPANSTALLSYLIKNDYNKHYKIVCYGIHGMRGQNVIWSTNLIRIFLCQITARFIFYSVAPIFTSTPAAGQIIVNMWHGSPFKRIGYMHSQKQWRDLSSLFSVLCVASESMSPLMKRSFGCGDSKIFINGSPRNDDLWHRSGDLTKALGESADGRMIIVWLPTYRVFRGVAESGVEFPMLTEENIYTVSEYCHVRNVLLVIKPHPLQDELPLFRKKTPNIIIIHDSDLTQTGMSLYNLLAFSDALLTDASSVFADYLILDRPIGFTLDDYDSYRDMRGFSFDDPISLMPGVLLYTPDDLLRFIDDISNGRDISAQKRLSLVDFYNQYVDNKNTERLVDHVLERLHDA